MTDVLDLLTFRRMLTPMLIRLVWWAAVATFLLTVIVAATSRPPSWGLVGIGAGLLLGGRILCEFVIIQFAIHEHLAAIRKALAP